MCNKILFSRWSCRTKQEFCVPGSSGASCYWGIRGRKRTQWLWDWCPGRCICSDLRGQVWWERTTHCDFVLSHLHNQSLCSLCRCNTLHKSRSRSCSNSRHERGSNPQPSASKWRFSYFLSWIPFRHLETENESFFPSLGKKLSFLSTEWKLFISNIWPSSSIIC